MFAAVFTCLTFALTGLILVLLVRRMEETERLIERRLRTVAESKH
jgi:hypothetical protein